MTTKNQKCKQPDCGRRWPYTGNKKKGGKTRCPDCQKTVTLTALALLALILLPLVGMAAADSQTVELPVDRPFEDQKCKVFQSSNGIAYSCIWTWIVDPEVLEEISITPTNQTDYEIWLEEILPIVEDNPFQERTADEDDVVPDSEEDEQTPGPLEEIDPEVRRAIDKLGECQFGVGAWAAFVNEYTRDVPDELPIFKSLDRERVLKQLAQNYEECRGMTEYPWLSAQYENAYLADQLGLDYLGRATETPGNQASLMFEQTKSVGEAEKTAEADKWRTWMCSEANLHLKLCNAYLPLTGENRGGYTGGADCQEIGQPASEGGQTAENRCPLRDLQAHERSEPTATEISEAVQKSLCDQYADKYEYLAIDKRPDWVSSCYE